MKTSARTLSARAFTLIELLVVITLIGILTSLAFSGYRSAVMRARNLVALAAVKNVTLAVQNYVADYNRMPVRSTAEESFDLSAGSPLLKVLMGENVDRLNPKAARFLPDQQMGKNGAGGLVGTEGQWAFVDPWGTPYRVALDADWDQRVANPDAQNDDPSIAGTASSWLPLTVIGSSAGADKKFGTRDDVVSWR